ncbi:MAG: coproporphyrinogen III oxidase [Chloroflexi bacterium]|nr:coproporphyrinogen III oxidase [Chloroflexota bacterium]|tara:strand:+ start:2700 stop:3947 length:1248 start_codon:yes stop_codon:yes gene_type:complete
MEKTISKQKYSTNELLPVGIYLHIPFCTTKCGYCDFNAYANLDYLVSDYTSSLIKEIKLWEKSLNKHSVKSIFFGGGTPSLTSITDLQQIISTIFETFNISPHAEFTLEANPTELTEKYLHKIRELGINRLSMGVQSMNTNELQLLERTHSPQQVLNVIKASRKAGFNNLNLDLIYGLMEQDLQTWQETVEKILDHHPEHLSCYALTIEPGTPFYYRVEKGLLSEPNPDIAAEQYEWTRERLEDAKYVHYEISNWAKKDHECIHNLIYWQNKDYLGIGAGAHSYFNGKRFANINAPNKYIELVNASYAEWGNENHIAMKQIISTETPNLVTTRSDAAILGLRLIEGIDFEEYYKRFEVDINQLYTEAITKHLKTGLLEKTKSSLKLSPKGLLLANEIFVDLLPDNNMQSINKSGD